MRGPLPLAGRTILVTRPREKSRPLADALRKLGAEVVEAPAIRIEPPSDPSALDAALRRITAHDWVVFTSANGVDAFFDRIAVVNPGADLSSLRFAAVGPRTAASLRERGREADLVPERSVSEEVFRALAERFHLSGKRFLLPRASLARETLPDLLEAAGALVSSVEAYRTVPADEEMRGASRLVAEGVVDLAIFASASAVRSFFSKVDPRSFAGRGSAASIGPITSEALRELGVTPAIEAESFTAEGLVEAILRHYGEEEDAKTHRGAN